VECLISKACTRVFEHYPANFSFEFGSVVLAVDCLWRLVGPGRLLLTSLDHRQQFGRPAPVDAYAEALALLRGHRVTAARLREETDDLILEFEGGLRLEVLADSAGYEPWNLTAPGVWLVARGGGGVVDFRARA